MVDAEVARYRGLTCTLWSALTCQRSSRRRLVAARLVDSASNWGATWGVTSRDLRKRGRVAAPHIRRPTSSLNPGGEPDAA
jgi:hypothetical protein